jgi:hypothetical protein
MNGFNFFARFFFPFARIIVGGQVQLDMPSDHSLFLFDCSVVLLFFFVRLCSAQGQTCLRSGHDEPEMRFSSPWLYSSFSPSFARSNSDHYCHASIALPSFNHD